MKHDQDLITLKTDKLRYYDDIRGDTDKQTSPYDVPGEAHLQELPGGAARADEQCEGGRPERDAVKKSYNPFTL